MLKNNNNNKREALISNYPNPAHKKKFSKQQIAGPTSYSFVNFFFIQQ
jgi:hypothetical protein